MKSLASLPLLFLALPLAACRPAASSSVDAPTGDVTSALATARPIARLDAPIPGGIAGGAHVLFVGSPMDGRVLVLSRATGKAIAELPQPAQHLALPLIIRAIGPTRIAVLDCGGFPAPGKADAEPTIHEYEYTADGHAFSATLVQTIHFTGAPIGFAEGFVRLDDGQYLVSDAVYGALWRVTAQGTVVPAIGPKSTASADAIPSMAYCPKMTETTVGGLPFLFTDATIPGVAGIAVRDDTVYFYSSCAAGLYRVPLATLGDARAPWERAEDIQRIAGKSADTGLEELLELQFNPHDPNDPYLYATDALQFSVIRIDPRNGERQIVSQDPHLFNFPASLGFLPPAPGEAASLVVLSNQQHRDPQINPAITTDQVQRPYLVTQVTLRR